MSYKLFIGRWSPFHKGHKYIIDSYVNNGHKVCIAIRDTKLSKKDPFNYELRKKLIMDYYKNKVEIIKVPDIDQVIVGRGVGYGLAKTPEAIYDISGTKEREKEKPLFNNGKGFCLWLTGLPCSGKTTIMNTYKTSIQDHTIQILDGDKFRKVVTPHLGFSKLDRMLNLQAAFDIIQVLVNNGVLVLADFVSPNRMVRNDMKKMMGDRFKEIYVKCSAEECKKRDVKGMWKLAAEGKIKDFTGYNSPYEEPEKPDLIIDTEKENQFDSIIKLDEFIEGLYVNT